jgi:starch-binding outer membrane protein, SusD/RagB family
MTRSINRLSRLARVVMLGGILAGGVVACDASQPLKVKDPDVAPPSAATGPSSLPFLQVGTLADFAVAVIGAADESNNGHEGIVNFGAIFTDEFLDEDTFPTRNMMNTRDATAQNASLSAVFENLGAAHNDAQRALIQFNLYGQSTVGQAEMNSIDGYVYIYVAEHFCSGVPFSIINIANGQVTNSPFLTTPQMFDTALARFHTAKTELASDTVDPPSTVQQQVELATIGTARALLDLGQVTPAADTAATITDPTFQYLIFESTNTTRQENGTWNYTLQNQSFSVGNAKNGTGLLFIGIDSTPQHGDPRVPWALSPIPANNGNPILYDQLVYPQPNSNMVVGSYTEAQLIVAEGDLFAGNYAGALTIMNTLRANFASPVPLPAGFPTTLGPLPSAGANEKAQMLQLLSERAFWMYVTGHRLGDWRRVLRPPYNGGLFSFVTSDVYPVGTGIMNILEFPTPQTTNPNPNYVACDPTQP